jgi:putative flippase GtrA
MIKKLLKIWFKLNEKLRFILIGGYNTVCSYLIFFTLNYFFSTHLHYLAILTFSYLISVSNSFFSLRFFVFQSKGNLREEYLKVNLVYFGYFLLNFISLYILKDVLNVEVLVAQLICVITLSIITYFFHKYFSFKK